MGEEYEEQKRICGEEGKKRLKSKKEEIRRLGKKGRRLA